MRTRKCYDAEGNEISNGLCEEIERELEMCNLGNKCDDSIWSDAKSHWSDWSDESECDKNEMKSEHRLCNFQSGNCKGLACVDCNEEDVDYKAHSPAECVAVEQRNVCKRIKMITDYNHHCDASFEELKVGYDGTES